MTKIDRPEPIESLLIFTDRDFNTEKIEGKINELIDRFNILETYVLGLGESHKHLVEVLDTFATDAAEQLILVKDKEVK